MPIASRAGYLLLVDDADNGRLLFKIAFQQAELKQLRLLSSLTNGSEAIAYLSGRDKFHDRSVFPYPDLLVLDLKMPHKSGFDVLEWLRTQPMAPVIAILSDSTAKPDKDRAFSLGVADYFVKPQGLPELVELMRTLERIYRTTAPRRPPLQPGVRARSAQRVR